MTRIKMRVAYGEVIRGAPECSYRCEAELELDIPEGESDDWKGEAGSAKISGIMKGLRRRLKAAIKEEQRHDGILTGDDEKDADLDEYEEEDVEDDDEDDEDDDDDDEDED